MEALRQAILQALMDSGQLTPEMLKCCGGESTGDPARDQEVKEEDGPGCGPDRTATNREGYLNYEQAAQMPYRVHHRYWDRAARRLPPRASAVQSHRERDGFSRLQDPQKSARAHRQVQPRGPRDPPPRHRRGGRGASKPYEFGDVLNLDVPATLYQRHRAGGTGVPLDLEYADLQVHQASIAPRPRPCSCWTAPTR